jgi:hypothetical protein
VPPDAATVDPTHGVRAKMLTLTPTLAAKLLQANTHNRSVSRSRVRQYAADMRQGHWAFNGEAIKIAVDGQILDGQHRLLAVLDADKPVDTLLITGLPPVAQETMDQGRSRTFADVLKLRGEADHFNLAAAVRIVCLYEREGIPYKAPFVDAPTVHECLRTLDRNGAIRDSVKLAGQLRRSSLIPVSTIAALHYLFASVNEADANAFMTKLLRGENIDASSPIYVLRDRLLVDLREKILTPKIKLAFIVRAWNAYMEGEHISRLMWNPGGSNPDRFPKIHGLSTPGVDEEPNEETP